MLFCQYCGRSLPNTSAVCECRRKPAPINDGGPAFAQVEVVGDPEFPGLNRAQLVGGMTLRDWFAGQALAGWLASFVDTVAHPGSKPEYAEEVARVSYNMADAMLAERAKRAG